MADDVSFLHAVLTGMTMAVTGFFAFMGRRFITKVDETAARLAQHEKDDIGKYVTGDQLVRVHARMDTIQQSTEDGFKETRMGMSEIKTLLINGVHR